MVYDVDAAIDAAGGYAYFQKLYTWGVLGYPWIICGMQTMVFVFVTLVPPAHRRCMGDEDCVPVPADFICDADVYADDIASSTISEWDLRCDEALWTPVIGSMFFFGFLIGVGSLGRMCDLYGRRRTFYLSLALLCFGGLWGPMLTASYFWYTTSRFIVGFAIGGLGLSSYVLNTEILPEDSRSITVLTQNCYFALGVLLTSVLAVPFPMWRTLSIVVGMASLPMIGYLAIPMIESPKWYATQPDGDALAHGVMREIARINGITLTSASADESTTRTSESAVCVKNVSDDSKNPYGILMNHPTLRTRIICMSGAWFACSMGYFGLSMDSSNLGPNIYVSSILGALVEFPSYMMAVHAVTVPSYGRRGTCGACLFFGGFQCMLSAFMSETLQLVLAMVGKFFMAAAFAVLYLYAAELFPTTLRSTALGVQSVTARIAGIIAPFIPGLDEWIPGLPLVVFGFPATVFGIAILRLMPETLGETLPATVSDVGVKIRAGGVVSVRTASTTTNIGLESIDLDSDYDCDIDLEPRESTTAL